VDALTLAPRARALGKEMYFDERSLEIVEGFPFEKWLDLGERLGRTHNTSAWWLGDWLYFGEHAYCVLYEEGIARTGLAYQTLANYRYVAVAFEPSRRRENLSFAHHAEVAAFEPPEQDEWLDRAEAEGWSRNELRARIREARQLSLPPRPSRARPFVRLRLYGEIDRWEQAAAAEGQELADWLTMLADERATRSTEP